MPATIVNQSNQHEILRTAN